MKIQKTVPAALALGLAAVLFAPTTKESHGFTILGGSLSAEGQRDWRLRNNFADPQTNNYQAPEANWPGWQGADMAMWKAASEWASRLHGDGSGTPGQDLGHGEANFDFAWMGRSTGAGNSNNNIASAIPSCGGNTLAFVQTPIQDGWTMKFCDNWTWADGPGQAVNGEFSLQGVATHEFGHSLGLGHSTPPAVMKPSTASGNDSRELTVDDQLGVQFIYGARSASKPEITDVDYDCINGDLIITGSNFSATNNQVWFTNANVTSTGSDPRVILSGVSSAGGGTSISVTVPANAASGDVHVKQNATGHSTLSNGYPLDIDGLPASADFRNGNGTNDTNYANVSGPNVAQNWISTVALKPGQTQSRVAISLHISQECHPGGFTPAILNGGELIARPPYLKPHDKSPTGTHSIPVTPDCALIGEPFCVQGFGLSFGPIVVEGFNGFLVTVGAP